MTTNTNTTNNNNNTAPPTVTSDPSNSTLIMGGQLAKKEGTLKSGTRALWKRLWGGNTNKNKVKKRLTNSNSSSSTSPRHNNNNQQRRSTRFLQNNTHSPPNNSNSTNRYSLNNNKDPSIIAEAEGVKTLLSLPSKLNHHLPIVGIIPSSLPTIDLHESGLFDALVRALEDCSSSIPLAISALVAIPSLSSQDLVRLIQREVQCWKISSGTLFKGCLEHSTSPALRAACAETLTDIIPRISFWGISNDIVPNTEHDRIESLQDINDWVVKIYRSLADRCADDLDDQVAISSFKALDVLFTTLTASPTTVTSLKKNNSNHTNIYTRASYRVVSHIRSYLSRFIARCAWTQTPQSIRVGSRVLFIACSSSPSSSLPSMLDTDRSHLLYYLLSVLLPLCQHTSTNDTKGVLVSLALTAQQCALDLITLEFIPRYVREKVQVTVFNNAMRCFMYNT
jgi:hypothetical protein